ncbi:MAG: hypothetical protein IPL53_24605 [Ignavibacteria bacterium]|nr:hypothetical protein [Ignavibacteria bacterium]
MKITLALFFLSIFISSFITAQTVTEKELFNLTYEGDADAYNFKYDSAARNYCYLYTIRDENKSFVISKNSISDKYDYIISDDIKFDSKGNYYVITSDYKADYGTNNYFLISEGKVIKSYNYMESYNAYVNKKDEFVFVFKEKDMYMIGYYNPKSGFRQSGPYENIKSAFNYTQSSGQMEGDAESYDEEDFFHNENGERAFIVISEGKAKILFESKEIATDYSDINESSLTLNKNDELSYIAKKEGRFYEFYGNEFVVSGSKEYDKFEIVSVPLLFNNSNEPVYIGGDSVSEDKFNYFLVNGNQIRKAYTDNGRSEKAPDFGSYITDVKVNDSGSITYIGNSEVIIPANKINPSDIVYDQYYTRSFFVKDGVANELGYNINRIKYNDDGDMLYSGIADLKKKENLLMLNYGVSKIIMNNKIYDDIYEYGFTPSDEIYYVGQNYEDSVKNQKYEASLFIGDKLIGKYDYFVYQTEGENSSIIKFDSDDNYAFVGAENTDPLITEFFILTNNGRLPFPSNVTGSKMFTYVSNLMYNNDDKLFYAGDMTLDTATYQVSKELFYNNKTLNKTYNSIYELEYDDEEDQITFLGSRGKKIYFVTVKL